jgi:hypothetical protein
MGIRPQKKHYTSGELVEFYCTGNLGNQVNVANPDSVWKWEMTSDNSDVSKWETYPNPNNIRYHVQGSSLNTCHVTGTTSLFHIIQHEDDGRRFRCSVRSFLGHVYQTALLINVDSK